MAIYKEDIADIELTTGTIYRTFLKKSIGEGDKLANRFGIRALRNGAEESLGGSCAGYFIRPTGDTVVIEGTVSGAVAYVDLPQACYAYEGQFSLAIKVTSGTATGTMRIVDGVVSNTTTGSVVDPGTVIPSVDDLIAAIEAAVASIPSDYTSLWTSLAPYFSTSNDYKIGERVTYDGKQYQFISDHEAGSWNSDQVRQITVGEEAYQTQSGINSADVIVVPFWGRGSLNSSGEETSSTTRLRTEYIEIKDNLCIESKDGYEYEIDYYDLSDGVSFLGLEGWLSGFHYVFKDGATHCRILLKREEGGTLQVSECDNIGIRYSVGHAEQIRAESYRYIYKASGATTGQIRPDVESAKIRVVPIVEGHTYDVFVHGGNRRLFALSNNADPVIGETVPFAETFSSNLTDDKIFRFVNGDYRFLYAYYQYGEYSGDPFEIETHDITALDLNRTNTFKGWSFNDSAGKVIRGADTEMCVVPLQKGTNYVLQITGGNRRRVGLSNDPYPVADNTVGKIHSSSGTGDTTVRFNSGEYQYAYVYYYTNTAEQLKAGSVVIEQDNGAEDTISESFTAAAQAGQGENTGDVLTVMSYNVYRYQVDTGSEAGMPDNRVLAFRKFLGKYNPDILCLQECGQYIDTSSSKTCTDYLFKPTHPNVYNSSSWSNANVIASKKAANTSGRVKYTDGGSSGISVEYATYTMGENVLLVCSSHITWKTSQDAADSAASIAVRLSNYTELLKWTRGQVTMPKLSDSSAVTVPEHTHCIIGMDANSLTATDKSNLASLAATYEYVMGNGGRMGWFKSSDIGTPEAESLDNILVSDNIIFNNVEALSSEYAKLYSDHVPLLANVTLL